MPLTDLQIDRYSRQIILGGVGGRGQERLLGSSIVIVGDWAEIETPFAYLVGAGVGEIRVVAADEPPNSIVARMRDRNPDVAVRIGDDDARRANLVLAFIGSASSVALASQIFDSHRKSATIIARLDDPPRAAVIPSPPPCVRCADANFFASSGTRAAAADFVAMVSTTESLKLLAGIIEEKKARLIEFEGYETRTRELARASRCDCGASLQGGKS
jgi:molybdopterin/thiamine biosynthesis adenylyltransferase